MNKIPVNPLLLLFIVILDALTFTAAFVFLFVFCHLSVAGCQSIFRDPVPQIFKWDKLIELSGILFQKPFLGIAINLTLNTFSFPVIFGDL